MGQVPGRSRRNCILLGPVELHYGDTQVSMIAAPKSRRAATESLGLRSLCLIIAVSVYICLAHSSLLTGRNHQAEASDLLIVWRLYHVYGQSRKIIVLPICLLFIELSTCLCSSREAQKSKKLVSLMYREPFSYRNRPLRDVVQAVQLHWSSSGCIYRGRSTCIYKHDTCLTLDVLQ